MRFFWLAALGVLAVVMAVFTPYVLRHESVWQSIGWLVMLVGTIGVIAVLIRAELLLRSLDRRARSDLSSR
ncbi:hypothetical protein [Streptomyces inhibens]|uniref:hypothetical protein n=1 Tax=Streptomyces inhibens TaxID=2293571 RepID=UPI001EE6E3E1|nr:hypothetical protein [Streptomyces inhibens]UKY47827.1 hypothetical protein KI385_02590 [Streptomyces inhibens]